jgi:hypothetical protein
MSILDPSCGCPCLLPDPDLFQAFPFTGMRTQSTQCTALELAEEIAYFARAQAIEQCNSQAPPAEIPRTRCRIVARQRSLFEDAWIDLVHQVHFDIISPAHV